MSLDVKKIAHLARIKLDESKVPQYQTELTNILGVVESMNQADDKLKDILPMSHPFEANQRLREDVVSEENQRELFQEGAPETEHGYYLVKQVIE